MAGIAGIGNYHTHTRHCDGRGEVRDFAESALRKGMPRLGFSGHNVLRRHPRMEMTRRSQPIPKRSLNIRASSPTVIPWRIAIG